MLEFRHLFCSTIAAVGLIFSTAHSYAQQPQSDPGDQPGLIADDTLVPIVSGRLVPWMR